MTAVEGDGRNNGPALNQAVGKKAGGDPLGRGGIDRSLEQILHRGVDPLAGGEGAAGQILDRLAGGAADVVGDAGAVTDLDEDVEIAGQRAIDGHVLDHRIAERTVGRGLQFIQ